MIIGAHTIIYSRDAEADRVFLRDVLGFTNVDAGHGWLIFKLPPAEIAVHPTEEEEYHEMYFMCDNLATTIADLESKGVMCTGVEDEPWGKLTSILLPGGGSIGLYEPSHPTAIDW
jgi:catechol 2,3-dioxygenase-like lactoylglutathione lyase family enzyme